MSQSAISTAANAAALPRVPAELLDFAKNLVHAAGVFAQNDTLQHQSIILARAVADFAESVDALIRIDANDRASHRRANNRGDPHVGDLQLGRLGIGVDVLLLSLQLLRRPRTLRVAAPRSSRIHGDFGSRVDPSMCFKLAFM